MHFMIRLKITYFNNHSVQTGAISNVSLCLSTHLVTNMDKRQYWEGAQLKPVF